MTGFYPQRRGITSSLRALVRMPAGQVAARLAHSLRGAQNEPTRTTIEDTTIEVPTTLVGPAPEGVVDGRGAVALFGAAPVDPLVAGWDVVGDPQWREALHGHGWLMRMAPERAAATIHSWIAQHVQGVGWEPYATSLRMLSWIGWLARGGEASDAATIGGSIAAQCDHLRRHVETHLGGHHVWTNLAAMAAAALTLRGPGAPVVEPSVGRFAACVAAQLDSDGVHVERTPTYHCMLAEQLAIVTDLAASRGLPHANALRAQLGRMLAALPAFTHPDGDVALWGDSRRGAGANPMALCRRMGIEMPLQGHADAPQAGFARRSFGPWTLLFNRGDIPRHAAHVHADAGSIELSLEDERMVVDAGTSAYAAGHDRAYARSTRAHNTVTVGLDHPDLHELWDRHEIGARARIERGTFGAERLSACVVGYGSASTHHRMIEGDASSIRITDTVVPHGPAVVRYFLPATLRVHPQGSGLRVETPRGRQFTIESSSGPPRIEAAVGWHGPGARAPRLCLTIGVQPAGSTVTFRL